MGDPDGRTPDELRELDRSLAGIRFRPRHGLGAELAGRAARPEEPAASALPRRRARVAAVAGALVVLLATWMGWNARVVTVDRCCYDLDGGSDHDDGVLVVVRRNHDVRRLAVYEDRDGSRSFTGGDQLRFSRGAEPTLLDPQFAHLVTFRHCCLDFDGGGSNDDGVLVVGVPPDRVMMAALYEETPGRTQSGWLLR
jgi:hypothetical protein